MSQIEQTNDRPDEQDMHADQLMGQRLEDLIKDEVRRLNAREKLKVLLDSVIEEILDSDSNSPSSTAEVAIVGKGDSFLKDEATPNEVLIRAYEAGTLDSDQKGWVKDQIHFHPSWRWVYTRVVLEKVPSARLDLFDSPQPGPKDFESPRQTPPDDLNGGQT